MKRSVGVTAAAFVMLLYGIVCFIAAVSLPIIIWSHTDPRPPTVLVLKWTRLAMFRETVVGIGFSITSSGIFRLRPWARISALSLSLGMIGFGAYLWISSYILLPNHGLYAHRSFLDTWLDFALLLFVILAVPGVWWIALFTRASVEAQFAKVASASGPPVGSEDGSPSQ